jgi:hypothetical protein
METSEKDSKSDKKGKKILLPVPPGTPYTILAQAVNKFNLEIVEKDVILPGSAMDEYIPKGWYLEGEKKDLDMAREFIFQKIKERVKKLE